MYAMTTTCFKANHQTTVAQRTSVSVCRCPRVFLWLVFCSTSIVLFGKTLRGFWARGRVRGDRSVFVTSHRPVHPSRALMFQPDSSFCISVQERYFLFAHLPPCCTSMSLDLELGKIRDAHNQGIATGVRTGVFCVNFTLRLLCSPGFRGQRSPPQRPVLRRSRNEPCSVHLTWC